MFRHPPRSTYAVYQDTFERRGADGKNNITEHDITIEVYEYKADTEKEIEIEKAFETLCIPFTKQERYWIQDEQLFQAIYEFSYVEKGEL